MFLFHDCPRTAHTSLRFRRSELIVIIRGMTYQFHFDDLVNHLYLLRMARNGLERAQGTPVVTDVTQGYQSSVVSVTSKPLHLHPDAFRPIRVDVARSVKLCCVIRM
jgi:hypothetical protein